MRKLAGPVFAVGLFSILVMAPEGPALAGQAAATPELSAPAADRPVKIDPAGETILPNGRLITPLGRQVKVAPHPYGLTISPDGKTLVTANSGTHPFSVSIITQLDTPEPQVAQIPPGFRPADADPDSVFLGVAVGPDNRTLYLSEGNNGRIGIFDLVTHQRLYSLSVDGPLAGVNYGDSLTASLQLSPDGRHLYILDLAHFRLVILDTDSKQIVSSLAVGRMPFGLALSPDGKFAYVSNVGTFQYSLVPGYDAKRPKETGLDFPPFGYPSKEAAEGVTIGEKQIPGLGDPNVLEANSLWVIEVADPAAPKVVAKVKTGIQVGDQSIGGSSPGAVVAGRARVFVSNATQDSITLIAAGSNQVEKTILLEPADAVKGLRGVLPFGMALSPDETRLYVACSGINAVAVLDANQGQVLGYIPTAWFPARLAMSPEGKTLYVANTKGFGAGPNGGPSFHEGPEGVYIGDITHGYVSMVSIPEEGALKQQTARVLENNGFQAAAHPAQRSADFPVPPAAQPSAKIHHVVFIVRENRTFDEVFGDLRIRGARIDREGGLARWGEKAVVKDKEEPVVVQHGRVTPNAHALARRFAFSDNFYVDSDVSVDGHHWLVGNYPNEVLESVWPASYGDRLDFRPDADAPGRISLECGNPCPETYLEAGSLWEHLARHHITFRNYGEGVSFPGDEGGPGMMPTGHTESVNFPLPEVLFENTSRSYATFNTNISDQYRFGQFQREFELRFASGKNRSPSFYTSGCPTTIRRNHVRTMATIIAGRTSRITIWLWASWCNCFPTARFGRTWPFSSPRTTPKTGWTTWTRTGASCW